MNIYVIGGGASGILTSILIKKQRPDINVVLVERNDRIGKKLLATGNGRCNFTNIRMSEKNFHSSNKNFPMKVIKNLDNHQAIRLFESLGISSRVEEDGRVFPLSLQGSAFLDILRINLQRLGVVTLSHSKIDQVKVNKDGTFSLKGDKDFIADRLVLATGGMAMPASGSDGLGYKLAKDTGHRIIGTGPSIVQLESDYKRLKGLAGVRIKTSASLLSSNEVLDKRYGDVLFTDYGLSGPAILDLSRQAIGLVKAKKPVQVSINLVNLEYEEIYRKILERMEVLPGLTKEEFLIGLIHKRLIHPVLERLEESGLSLDDFIYPDPDLAKALCQSLYDFRINITGHRGYRDAQTTSGGVDTRDLNYNLESKLVPGLYFTGELVDVDGDCGGYNLQWAWSSAYTVTQDIIGKLKS